MLFELPYSRYSQFTFLAVNLNQLKYFVEHRLARTSIILKTCDL
jgi:hypothetical protein